MIQVLLAEWALAGAYGLVAVSAKVISVFNPVGKAIQDAALRSLAFFFLEGVDHATRNLELLGAVMRKSFLRPPAL